MASGRHQQAALKPLASTQPNPSSVRAACRSEMMARGAQCLAGAPSAASYVGSANPPAVAGNSPAAAGTVGTFAGIVRTAAGIIAGGGPAGAPACVSASAVTRGSGVGPMNWLTATSPACIGGMASCTVTGGAGQFFGPSQTMLHWGFGHASLFLHRHRHIGFSQTVRHDCKPGHFNLHTA